MTSMSLLGVEIPLLLVFWKQCSTNTASLKLDGVDGAVGSVRIVFDYLQYSGTAEALRHLGGVVLLAVLGKFRA